MSDEALFALAAAAGISLRWRDAHGAEQRTGAAPVRAILDSLGLGYGDDAAVRDSIRQLEAEALLPPLCTATAGEPVLLRRPDGPLPEFELTLEDGGGRAGVAEAGPDGLLRLPAVAEPGYHRLRLGGRDTVLAVAPRRCFEPADAAPGARPWGLSVQLYGLRRPGDGGVGDFTALAEFGAAAAARGADAVAISPVHAQFSADPDRFSPYAPSSRLFLNVLHVDPGALGEPSLRQALAEAGTAEAYARLEGLDLVDWPEVARVRLPLLRALFRRHGSDPGFAAFRAEGGEALERHARFEALHAHLFGGDPGLWNWRHWPAEFRDPAGAGVAAFAAAHAGEVSFHAFAQWLAARGLEGAQRATRDAGARIGLIADLAVGTDAGGSHGWSRQQEVLPGLTVGAPPDIFSPLGQSWGIAAFSPRGLRRGGFGAFTEMLGAAMRHAGGVRIDHALGLARLWLVPEGAEARDGAYLAMPVEDMLRLIALESRRHRAVVVGEDLGTVPEGFRDRLDAVGMMGLRVLWFEQDEARGFTPPSAWTPDAVAVTTTHDLPTVAGWWAGRDIDWRSRLGLLGAGADGAAQRDEREGDRAALWQAMLRSGAAHGPQPAPGDGAPVADAAAAHVGGAASALALLPVEDALALPEQPNLPGTTDQHPNWRRRLPGPAARLLDDPAASARLQRFAAARAAPAKQEPDA